MGWPGRNSPTNPRRVIAAERRAKAVELRRAGWHFTDIGRELGVTGQAAGKMVRRALAELAKEAREDADALRALESERLAEVAMVLRPMALAGDVAAAREYRAYSESFRKLWGLDVRPDDGAQTGPQFVIVAPPWEREGGTAHAGPPVIDTARPALEAGTIEGDEGPSPS